MKIQKVQTDQAPQAIGPYSQAVKIDGFLFTSGQIPLNAAGELVQGGIEEQTRQVFRNLEAVLNEAGAGFNDVIKVTVFMKDMNQFSIVNDIYAEYFASHQPARSTVEVARLPKDVGIEIEVMAKLPIV